MGTAMGRFSMPAAAIAALLMTCALTAAEIGAAVLERPHRQVAPNRWARALPAMVDKAICRWGVTAGYGQPVCGAWGIASFPATSARPVAIWLAPTILSGTIPRRENGTAG